jgi:RND family efflux transporter MFP subunit
MKSRPIVASCALALAAVGAVVWGISARTRELAEVTKETQDHAVTPVAVVTPERGLPQEEIVLPGTMQPFVDSPIYARTSGYLKRWYADIGTRVQAGQLLAEIDAPEVEQQLLQARADEATEQANARLARTTADRYRELIKTESVAQQDLDNANGNLEARQAAVASAHANVVRLERLQGFARIEAPFAGMITARNTDVGALIDSGSNARELFHIADTRRLRVFVNVPETYSRSAQAGLHADLTLKEFPGRRFAGMLARTSQSIDVASRTLLTEIDVDNARGELLPGSYCEVHLKLPGAASSTLKLPVNAIVFKAEGLQVATVENGNRIALKTIAVGRDYGGTIEVVSGLDPNAAVVINPPDSVAEGQAVRVVADQGADR